MGLAWGGDADGSIQKFDLAEWGNRRTFAAWFRIDSDLRKTINKPFKSNNYEKNQ